MSIRTNRLYQSWVGKTHLAIVIGISAIQNGYTGVYRSIFDFADELAEAHALGFR
ncbi:MAG: ATP-binding protein [Candidatus Delongbacteria bacterium]|nr:ATP-binding protein [Candidatus Delongbacteria bacterium]